MTAPEDTARADRPIRIDKWLWHARFFKSRRLASEAVTSGPLRLNGQRVAKPSQTVRHGDVVTFVQGRTVRVARVLAPGHRRGPASEAQALYEDLTPAPDPAEPSAPRVAPGGRPTGKSRRAFDAARSERLE